ncbi:MAG: hypothetical protein HQ481_21265 [Alphaproteobacteria bacterium]|nr:hypothetical protein [Alphaproteobacteria bacterium]
MTDCERRCLCRGSLTARAARAEFADTLVVGTMMAAGIAASAWLLVTLAV